MKVITREALRKTLETLAKEGNDKKAEQLLSSATYPNGRKLTFEEMYECRQFYYRKVFER